MYRCIQLRRRHAGYVDRDGLRQLEAAQDQQLLRQEATSNADEQLQQHGTRLHQRRLIQLHRLLRAFQLHHKYVYSC